MTAMIGESAGSAQRLHCNMPYEGPGKQMGHIWLNQTRQVLTKNELHCLQLVDVRMLCSQWRTVCLISSSVIYASYASTLYGSPMVAHSCVYWPEKQATLTVDKNKIGKSKRDKQATGMPETNTNRHRDATGKLKKRKIAINNQPYTNRTFVVNEVARVSVIFYRLFFLF